VFGVETLTLRLVLVGRRASGAAAAAEGAALDAKFLIAGAW
jgi:hypothetical protein